MSDQVVLTEARNGVLFITINRPEAKNAVNRAVAVGIAAAIDELESNDELRAGILSGAANTFCSGMDLKAFVSGEVPIVEGRGFAGLCEYRTAKPLIAAVEGFALAGGFELAISCDLIVAAEDSRFGIPEVKRGLVAGAGGLVKLPKQIPLRIAKELALTGDFISATRAYELCLINEVVPAGTALEAAEKLAGRIAANGPLAVAASKEIVDKAQDWNSEDMFAQQQVIAQPVFTSADAIEGATAFAEKRAPQWKGR
ncbi:crotonase/enoyl-CoA hydratase family protein [Parahaliea aestuarii]|uniref:Crotonase/enoyl-CoA hydratase family protein n=1 Tax=Parahaliea aestuarii TaxID=1852021 RepID=A0A5C8ZX25_9GAMM|nr:crotonase/enoyl-CoA hydratase family protein [Parahaliea aestuarii]TXS93123.1 crotonase/enoyl-CoA hydratase family protein [Parahaliea aestuarii]